MEHETHFDAEMLVYDSLVRPERLLMTKRCGYVEVGDIFEALNLEDAAALRAQTSLGVEVCKRIRAMKATRKEIAMRLGITHPQVSELKRGKFNRFSTDRLIALLGAMGRDVELRVTPAPRRRAGRFTVKAA